MGETPIEQQTQRALGWERIRHVAACGFPLTFCVPMIGPVVALSDEAAAGQSEQYRNPIFPLFHPGERPGRVTRRVVVRR